MKLAAALAIAGLAAAPTPAAAQPAWWLALGGLAAVETGDLDETLGTEGSGLVGAGVYLARGGPVRLGLEAEGSGGRVSAALGPAGEDDVTVWRGRVGVRAAWWRLHDAPRLVPYVRGGGVYRMDRGDLVEDEGFGWYLGAGLDVRVGARWAVGPFVTYEAVGLSVDTRTVLFGLAITFSP
jgi:hypothetical protein